MKKRQEEKRRGEASIMIIKSQSQKCLLQVALKSAILKWHIRTSKIRVLQRILGRLGHRIPIRDINQPSDRVCKLQLMVGWERGIVLDLRRRDARQVARDLLVRAMARGRAADDVSSARVEPEDDVLPVVAVRARRDAVGRLVLGEVPRVHDARDVGRGDANARIHLRLGRVAASAAAGAAGLESTTVFLRKENVLDS